METTPETTAFNRVETTPETTAFNRAVNPVLELIIPPNADALERFRPDPALAKRIEELAQKSNEGEFTDSELAEYRGNVRANKFVSILRKQAERIRSHTPAE